MGVTKDFPTDGRRARGQASRRALLEATLAVIQRDGASGVTHRAVTTEAGTSPSAITYHFGSIDELFVSAIRAGTERWSAAVHEELSGSFTDDLAALLLAATLQQRERLTAELELYVLAARRPALRESAVAWAEAIIEPLGELDEVTRRSVLAAIDGLCIQLLLADEPLDVAVVSAVLDRALAPTTAARRRRRSS